MTKPFTVIPNIKVLPTFSRVNDYLKAEALSNNIVDYSKAGITFKIRNTQEKEFTSPIDQLGSFAINLPVSNDEFRVTLDAPGHFTATSTFTVFGDLYGTLYGKSKLLGLDDLTAGDVNKDSVIDIMDAVAIQVYWGTNKRSADINFDGKVDEKDLFFVEKNYMKQNEKIDSIPETPKKKYKGKTLEDIKEELGV
ncbi:MULTISPECIES: dockerin type I domain-containing protein [unclassified Bacillus (in: firmicutes)]|uniref:dockerin type I domain-containing protein n=1 Tax=unclassified Bacillus (in: firmicutes) TaxID=185979 RepID=UPI0011559EEB|nr:MULTISPECIES: dockerin type I domain-containing protein [unclassified Bacillus (in: firmicutes)]